MTATVPKLILASQSHQRRSILETLGIPFEVVPAHLDEAGLTDPDPAERARRLAVAKVEAIAELHPDAIIIGGDTYVLSDGVILEKPNDLQEAAGMLRRISGSTITAVTGYAYLDPAKSDVSSGVESVKVKMRELSSVAIDRYVESEPVTTWSAAFSPAYDTGIALVASIDGSCTAFTHGLPLEKIAPLLSHSGFST